MGQSREMVLAQARAKLVSGLREAAHENERGQIRTLPNGHVGTPWEQEIEITVRPYKRGFRAQIWQLGGRSARFVASRDRWEDRWNTPIDFALVAQNMRETKDGRAREMKRQKLHAAAQLAVDGAIEALNLEAGANAILNFCVDRFRSVNHTTEHLASVPEGGKFSPMCVATMTLSEEEAMLVLARIADFRAEEESDGE